MFCHASDQSSFGKDGGTWEDQIISGRNTVLALHFRGSWKSGNAGLPHQHSDESLTDPDPMPSLRSACTRREP